MPLPKSSVVVRFGKLDQHRSPKNTILGTLESALNIRQRKLGSMDTRYGSSSLTLTPDSGSVTDAYALGNNGGSAVLQTSSTIFLADVAGSALRNKGSHTVVMPGAVDVQFALKGQWPNGISSGSYTWAFANDRIDSCIYYRVTNTSTGMEVVAPTKVNGSASGMQYGKTVIAGGYVWFLYFFTAGSTFKLYSAKFDPAAPTTAPVNTQIFTTLAPAGTTPGIEGFDVILPSGGTDPVIVIYGPSLHNTGDETYLLYMDVTTGGMKASPGLVGGPSTASTGVITTCPQPYAWLRGSTTSSLWLVGRDADGGGTLELFQINSATLVKSSTTVIDTGVAITCNLTGYLSGTNKVFFLSTCAAIENSVVTRYVVDNALAITSTVFCRAGYVVTDPFQYNSSWYIVTGHDDVNPASGVADNLQRAYYLRDASSLTTLNIVSRALYGAGGDVFMRGAYNSTTAKNQYVGSATVSGSTITAMVNGNVGGASDFATYKVVWTFGSLGAALANVDEAETLFPGGWPRKLVSESLLCEQTPMMYPTRITGSVSAGGSLAAGVYEFAAVYKITDPRGYVSRSAPATCTVTTSGGNLTAAIVIPYLRTVLNNDPVTVEVYATATDGSALLLIDQFVNVPTSDSVTKTYSSPLTYGEALYTGGGVLPNYPVPPYRAAFTWNDRLWVLGTEYESEAWHSKQFSSGISPDFAPPLKVTCYGGSGSLRAGGVISSDYAVLFKRDAVFAVTGAGPDDTGAGGSFQVRRLNWDGGCDNHASVINYPGGTLFQGLDGLIYRVTSGLSVDDPGADAQDYASATVYRAVHVAKAREVRFYLSTGKVLVLDYGMANENAPNGYWYLDQSTTWSCGAGGAVAITDVPYFVDSTGTVWQEVSGQYFDGSSTPILPKCDVNTLQIGDLGGEFRVSRVFFYGAWHSLHDLRVSIGADDGAAVNYDASSISGSPEVFVVRPHDCGRIASLDISVERTGSGTGQGFSFDGLVIEVQPKGRAKRLNSGQRI